MMVGFHHGALCDTYEKQANDQGFTLGNKAEHLQKCGHCLIYLHIHGILTDSQYDKALQKLQKKLVKTMKPLIKENNK